MKKCFFLFMTLVIVVSSLSSCSIVQAAMQISNEVKFECASVVLDDGTIYDGYAVLPNGFSEKVRFKTSDGTKFKLQASKIDFLTMWKEGHEDNKFIFVYRDAYLGTTKKKGDVFKPMWMMPEAAGPHLAVMAQADDYQFNANGEMLLVGTVIHYYFFKNGENHGYDLADRGYSNSESLARKNIVNFLGDDPRLSEAVESKSIDPFDFDAICDMYKPKVFGDNVLEQ